MKVVLSTLNARFVHSSLALAYLKAYCHNPHWQIHIREFTINDELNYVLSELYKEHPRVVCFSCYIWNIELVMKLVRDLRQVDGEVMIVLGGPEVSYETRSFMELNPEVDIVVRGEGEATMFSLFTALFHSHSLSNVEGITYRYGETIVENPDRPLIEDLDTIPFTYNLDNLNYYRNRTLYYETSRGCPFNCAYCLSSTIKGVRFFSLERVKSDLAFLMQQKVKEIRFVDRTFNCNEKRAREIMEFIIRHNISTRFHFEMGADLLSEEMLSFLETVPAGIFDLEIGIQSTCPEALQAVNRTADWQSLQRNVKRLAVKGNLHLHVDLIAGLPYESYERFGQSFDDVYALQADVIQLGFLKLLKGSSLRDEADRLEYAYQSHPPYQVLSSNCLSYGQLIKLVRIEDLVERYYNSGFFKHTLKYLTRVCFQHGAFKFYEEFGHYWVLRDLFSHHHQRATEYTILIQFIESYYSQYSLLVGEVLKLDYLTNQRSVNLPEGMISFNPDDWNKKLYIWLKDELFLQQFLPEMKSLSPRQIRRRVHLEYLKIDPGTGEELSQPEPVLFVYPPGGSQACSTIKLPLY